MVEAGRGLEGLGDVRADRVVMHYWFANFPSTPERFEYDRVRRQADREYVTGLVTEIAERLIRTSRKGLLPATEDESRCRVCRYRSLCRRGVGPGDVDEFEGDAAWSLDLDVGLDGELEQVAEREMG